MVKNMYLTFLNYNSKSKVLSTIVKYINVYLIKNKGASIDFHLINITIIFKFFIDIFKILNNIFKDNYRLDANFNSSSCVTIGATYVFCSSFLPKYNFFKSDDS